jgi:hypothetical protein
MAHNLFEYLVYDLDAQRLIDFKLKSWAKQCVVFRAAVSEEEVDSGKYDPGRIRTFDQVLKRHLRYRCATGPH